MPENLLVAGLCPGSRWGSLQRSPDPELVDGWLPPPQELHPRSRSFGNKRLGHSQHGGLGPPMSDELFHRGVCELQFRLVHML